AHPLEQKRLQVGREEHLAVAIERRRVSLDLHPARRRGEAHRQTAPDPDDALPLQAALAEFRPGVVPELQSEDEARQVVLVLRMVKRTIVIETGEVIAQRDHALEAI